MRITCYCNTLIAVVACLACGCDGATRISGRIIDQDGNGITGATLRLVETPEFENRLSRPQIDISNETGAYEFSFAHPPINGKFNLVVTHLKYSAEQEVITTGTHKNHDIRLTRIGPPKPVKDD